MGRLVVGGANDVCGPPGTATPAIHTATMALGASLAVAVALALVGRVRLSAGRAGLLVLLAALVAAPGAQALLVERADAPLRAKSTAKAIASLLDDMNALAVSRHGCVTVAPGDCAACQPLLRFVLPQRAACAHGDGRQP